MQMAPNPRFAVLGKGCDDLDFEPDSVHRVAAGGDKLAQHVVRWCTAPAADVAPETTAFVAPRTAEVFAHLVSFPETALCLGRDDAREVRAQLERAGWFNATTTPPPNEATRAGVALLVLAMAREVRKPATCRLTATTLRLVQMETARARRARAFVASRVFSALMPPRARVMVCALSLLDPYLTKGFVASLPPWLRGFAAKGGEAAKIPPQTLVREGVFPRSVPGLACETAFRAAVGEWADLHHALVFSLPGWADEWRARGWSTSRRTQAALSRVHASGWRVTRDDAARLVAWAVHAG